MKRFLALTMTAILILCCGATVSARELFNDVPENDWAAPFIYNLADRGIVCGYGDGTFGRNNNVLRCEYAKMLVSIAGINIINSNVSAYSDVPATQWYFPYVNSVAAYMTGFQSDGVLYFDPEAPATREVVTVAMVKARNLDISAISDPVSYLSQKFSDWEQISPHNRAYIAAAVEEGIITGDVAGTFRPHDPIIRAEIVVILYRAFPDGTNVQPAVSGNYEDNQAVNSTLTAFFLDVGQGDSCFIELPNGETMLIDAGTASSADYIVSFISNRGHITIDYVVATHPHADHIGGMAAVFEKFEIKNMYMPSISADSKTYKNMMASVESEGCPIIYTSAGVEISSIPQVSAVFVAPNAAKYSDVNNYSAVLRLDMGDSSYLFSGDAEELSEGEILSFGRNIDADVLKVGHHGSDTSSSMSFLQSVSPNVSVISCGVGNSYGHPTSQVLERLASIGSSVFRTDLDGTITVSADGSDITSDDVTVSGKNS